MVSQIRANLGAKLQLVDEVAKFLTQFRRPFEHVLTLSVVKHLPEFGDVLRLLRSLRLLLRINILVRMKRLVTKFFDVTELGLNSALIRGEQSVYLPRGLRPTA